MMILKNVNLIKILFIVSLLISFDARASMQDDPSISLNVRIKVLENYYGENLDNPDISILEEYRRWWKSDLACLRQHIPNDRTDLVNVCDQTSQKMAGYFDGKELSLTLSRLGLVYGMYATILDAAEDEEDVMEIETFQVALNLLQKTDDDLAKTVAAIPAKSVNTTDYVSLPHLCLKKFRFLPFVSRTGAATFEQLHQTYALKTPLMGVPLAKSPYDGNLPSEVCREGFFSHDMQHAMMDTGDSRPELWDNLAAYYKTYAQIFAVMKNVTCTQREKDLVSWFAFHFGHEDRFDEKYGQLLISYMQYHENPFPASYQAEPPVKPIYQVPSDLASYAEDTLKKLLKGLHRIRNGAYEGNLKLEAELQNIKKIAPGAFNPLKPMAYDDLKLELHKQVDRALEEMQISTLRSHMLQYNLLFDLSSYVKETFGKEIPVWLDGQLNIQGFESFYKEAHAAFMKVIVPAYKKLNKK